MAEHEPGERRPYEWVEEKQIACSTTPNHVDLDYKPDELILGNPSNSHTIFVSFDEMAAETRGIPINPNHVLKLFIRAHRISAVADTDTPRLYILGLAYRRERW